MQVKLCGRCRNEKPISEFADDKRTITGLKWACRPCEIERCREDYQNHRKKRIAASILHRKRNPEFYAKQLAKQKSDRTHTREKVLSAYGGKCRCCGEKNKEFLTVDHIDRDGRLHRMQGTLSAYKDMLKNIDHKKYRILCMNCNWAIRYGAICPHAVLAKSKGDA